MSAIRYCTKCGKEISQDSKFCGCCGTEITQNSYKKKGCNNKGDIVKVLFLISFTIILLGRLLENEAILIFGQYIARFIIIYLLLLYIQITILYIRKSKKNNCRKYFTAGLFVWISIIIIFYGIIFKNEIIYVLGGVILVGTLGIWSVYPTKEKKIKIKSTELTN